MYDNVWAGWGSNWYDWGNGIAMRVVFVFAVVIIIFVVAVVVNKLIKTDTDSWWQFTQLPHLKGHRKCSHSS